MADAYGSIEQLSPRNISWNLTYNQFSLMRLSQKFTVFRDNYEFFFQLFQCDLKSAALYLCQTKAVSLQISMHINLYYAKDTKNFSLVNFTLTGKSKELATIKSHGLRRITCNFSNIREINGLSDESVGNASNDAQAENSQDLSRIQVQESNSETNESVKTREGNTSEDAQIEISQKLSRIQVDESISDSEEPVKTRGLLALSANLKDVFLDEEDSDIILNVGNQKYPAHKIIIRARSPVFYAMLKHDMKEKRQGSIDIADCDPHIFKDFLLYLYTGKLDNISNENVFELYHMSDKYEINELKMDCIDYIFSNLSVDIICDVISLATKHCERDLLTYATKFFIENAKDILLTVNWQTFVKENPTEANELFIKTFNKVSEK